jgi:hypothetical protein
VSCSKLLSTFLKGQPQIATAVEPAQHCHDVGGNREGDRDPSLEGGRAQPGQKSSRLVPRSGKSPGPRQQASILPK